MSEAEKAANARLDNPGSDRSEHTQAGASTPPSRFGYLVSAALLLMLPGSLVAGVIQHHKAAQRVAATADQHRTFEPRVRVATVRPSEGTITVSLPATTTAFE